MNSKQHYTELKDERERGRDGALFDRVWGLKTRSR